MGRRWIPEILVGVCLFAGNAPAQQLSPSPSPVSPPLATPPWLAPQVPVPLAQPNPQGATLFQQSLNSIGAQAPVTDVTLTGSITVLKGQSPSETGTITLAAIGDTQALVTMVMPSGTRTEVRTVGSDGTAAEKWTGPDGTVQHRPTQSLLTSHPAWFFPQFVMTVQQQSSMGSSFVASETRNGTPVNHLQVWQLVGNGPVLPAPTLQHQTQFDLYLDPVTSLPTAMVFYVQPDYPNKPSVVYSHRDTRLPVEIRFADYQVVQGRPVALNIQAFIQGRQIYDIQLSSATFNTGVVIASAN